MRASSALRECTRLSKLTGFRSRWNASKNIDGEIAGRMGVIRWREGWPIGGCTKEGVGSTVRPFCGGVTHETRNLSIAQCDGQQPVNRRERELRSLGSNLGVIIHPVQMMQRLRSATHEILPHIHIFGRRCRHDPIKRRKIEVFPSASPCPPIQLGNRIRVVAGAVRIVPGITQHSEPLRQTGYRGKQRFLNLGQDTLQMTVRPGRAMTQKMSGVLHRKTDGAAKHAHQVRRLVTPCRWDARYQASKLAVARR